MITKHPFAVKGNVKLIIAIQLNGREQFNYKKYILKLRVWKF